MLLGRRIGTYSHPILQALAVELNMVERGIPSFAEVYGELYYTPKPGEKRQHKRIDLNIIINQQFKKYLETKFKFEGFDEVALDFHILSEKGEKYVLAKFPKGYWTSRQVMRTKTGIKTILRPLIVVAYGPNSEANSDIIKQFKDIFSKSRRLGEPVALFSFDEYYKDFLDLENPKIDSIHLRRLLALNNLIKEAYDNPDAYERLYNLYRYYFNKLSFMGCGKTDYESYYGL